MINKIIVALFRRNKKGMRFSNANMILFISKLVFCLLIFIYGITTLHILENNFHFIDISWRKPKNRWGYLPVMLVLYFILNHFTWKENEVEAFDNNPENDSEIKSAWILFLFLLVLGFIFMVIVAKYNQGNPLSD